MTEGLIDFISFVLVLVVWLPTSWQLFKKVFGSPKEFFESFENSRGSELYKLFGKGLPRAFSDQLFEITTAVFVLFNFLIIFGGYGALSSFLKHFIV